MLGHLVGRRTDSLLCGAQIGAFAGCAAIIGILFYWFNPSAVEDCSFNVGITVVTIILCVLVAMAPLHPSVRLPVPSRLYLFLVLTDDRRSCLSLWPRGMTQPASVIR